MRSPALRPKERRSVDERYHQYEVEKKLWEAAHPEATHEEYERAIRVIAKECGV